MTIDLNTKELIASFDDLATKFLQLIEPLNDKQVNFIPFEDSWTAGQLADHVTKSNSGIAKAFDIDGHPVEREPDQREKELKKIFLDFSTKMKSPDFILPTNEAIYKEALVADLEKSVGRLKEDSIKVNLSEAINHKAFGEITKLELLYFVKYHMQRHLHQLTNIVKAIDNN